MDESWRHDDEWKKPGTKTHLLSNSIYIKFPPNWQIHRDKQTSSGLGATRVRNREWLSNGDEISFGGYDVSELLVDRDDDCTALWPW